MDSKDASIISQVAAKAATEITIAAMAANPAANPVDHYAAFSEQIFNDIVAHATGLEQSNAVSNVTQAFPGATVQAPAPGPAPVSAPAPGPAPAAPAGPGPAPIPGASTPAAPVDKDADWRDLFDNFGNWYDNRQDKRSANAPDFKHKSRTYTDKNGKEQKVALWIDDKTPAWARQQLVGV